MSVVGRGTRRVVAVVRVALVALAMSSCSADRGDGEQAGRAAEDGWSTYEEASAFRADGATLRRLTAALEVDSPQRAALADGVVSRPELWDAWHDYAGCLEAAGLTVSTPTWDPVTGVTLIHTYAPAPPAGSEHPLPTPTGTVHPPLSQAESQQVDLCEDRYWYPVSVVYESATPPRMAAGLADAVVECMGRRGYSASGATTFGQVVGATQGRARGPRVTAGRECLAQAMADLYPDLPYYPRP